MGQLSGAGGTGKQALVKTLKKFIGECLAVDQPKPRLGDMANLEAWHNGWVEAMQAEERELQLLIDQYAAILSGIPVKQPK